MSVTNNHYNCFISPSSIALQTYYVTLVEDRHILSAGYRPPVLVKSDPAARSLR